MSDGPRDLRADLAPLPNEPIDPVAMARRDLKKALPRRFYKEVAVAESCAGFGPTLDGKPIRTPAKAALAVPTRALAEAIAAEWAAQGEIVEPDTMPLTKLANSAIDGVANTLAATAAEVAKFAETDLVCYRADGPETLVAEQARAWDPVLASTRETLGATFVRTQGILHVAQPLAAVQAVHEAVFAIAEAPAGPLRLAALSVMTSLTGSVLIALAVARGAMTAEAAWAAANVDEEYQLRHWGTDADALARTVRRRTEMLAAARQRRRRYVRAPSGSGCCRQTLRRPRAGAER